MPKKLAKRVLSAPVEAPKTSTYKILSCPLFRHMKHSDACTVLRAKGVCRMQCHAYFEFANSNEEAVKATISRYIGSITDHRSRNGLPPEEDLLEYVMPSGDHLCKYCGKSFVHESGLERHLGKKHARLIHEEKQEQTRVETKKKQKQEVAGGISKTGSSGSAGRGRGVTRDAPRAVSGVGRGKKCGSAAQTRGR